MITAEKKFQLTPNNYYTNEANWHYQSKSWFTKFEECEAEALAELKGEYKDTSSNDTPLIAGNYLHSYFESKEAHETFLESHKKDIFKYGNPEKGIKSDYLIIEKCINKLNKDPYFPRLYQGEKEVIVTGEIYGVNWMGKVDCLDLNRKLFFDLKTVDKIHKGHWSSEQHKKLNFAQSRQYDMQMAVYKELIKQTFGVECEPIIIAVSKENEPDLMAISIPQYLMDFNMEQIKEKQPHIQAVIEGEEKPNVCGRCSYCRANKTLDVITPLDEIEIE
ncbi:PD-(D/E)XK nuclease-like domain-containing protein [Pediococcus pentosaceus]|uniref:PD-(D/E)XK nuclease-like domain-containing protein n=1 Tax=Pediococcus pentosaceus TaxID=1255 RepID=UPI0018A19754|nr:PD-(D/E)XK nuclease-like domain-containing protein [Pediococcus pentosaceus]MBF7109921.1 PD-(D/E)XK nuclease-like domain-containing protein [Pediococcus pentosaceus]QQA91591.1 PD-(D/E)XK nuclease-like domain-containing protein [Pediococcus pentosaceus]